MKNLKKIIQAATIATVLLGTAKVSQGVELQLPCGASTILAGFKFGHICQNGIDKYSIENTYDTRRSLTIDGNFAIKNGSAYQERDKSISVIDFPPRKFLEFNVNKNPDSKFKINSRHLNILKLTKSISISCKSGTKRIAEIVITPTCSSQTPSFFVENTSGGHGYWVAYQGVRGDFKLKNFILLYDVERQHKFDLSIISNPRTSSSQAYTFLIYNHWY